MEPPVEEYARLRQEVVELRPANERLERRVQKFLHAPEVSQQAGKQYQTGIPKPHAELPLRKERSCTCSRGPVQALRRAGTGPAYAPDLGCGGGRRVAGEGGGRTGDARQ